MYTLCDYHHLSKRPRSLQLQLIMIANLDSKVVSGNSTPPLRTPIKYSVKIFYEGDARFSLYHIFRVPK
jgi:hypothetical protein